MYASVMQHRLACKRGRDGQDRKKIQTWRGRRRRSFRACMSPAPGIVHGFDPRRGLRPTEQLRHFEQGRFGTVGQKRQLHARCAQHANQHAALHMAVLRVFSHTTYPTQQLDISQVSRQRLYRTSCPPIHRLHLSPLPSPWLYIDAISSMFHYLISMYMCNPVTL